MFEVAYKINFSQIFVDIDTQNEGALNIIQFAVFLLKIEKNIDFNQS